MFRIKKLIFNYWPLLIFVFIFSLFIFSLYQRVPNEDEAVIAGHSYFYNKLGFVKSDLYGGYGYNWEDRQYHYHKLFVLTGSLFIKFFGFDVYTFKSVSLVFTIIFFVFLFRYIKIYFRAYRRHFLIVSSVLLFNSIFFDHSFMFRPEIMVMTLGFISFYFLIEGINKSSNILIILGGIFAGLSAFTHLNGLIYCSAGAVLLLFRKKFLPFVLFGFFAGLFSLLYFFDITSLEDFNLLKLQFATDPNVIDKRPFLNNLFSEQMRFLWSPKEISFTLIFLIALLLSFRTLRKENPNLLIYLLCLIISLGILAHGKTTKYALNYYPYMAIIIGYHFREQVKAKNITKYITFFFLALYFVVNLIYTVKLINSRINIKFHNKEIASRIPEKEIKISAPEVFVFNEIFNYTVRGPIAFDHHYYAFKPDENRTVEKYFSFAAKNGDRYLIVDRNINTFNFLRAYDFSGIQPGDTLAGFKLLSNDNKVYIFRNISSQ